MDYDEADKWAQRNIADPYFEGIAAFGDGVAQDDNTYPVGTHARQSWDDGYRDAAIARNLRANGSPFPDVPPDVENGR